MSEHGGIPPRRRRKLKNLHVDRVDFVRAGANQGAHVTLYKAEEEVVEKRIVERDGEFCVQSKDGSRSFGCYGSKAEAVERLQQVEGFSKREFKSADDTVEVEMEETEAVEAPEAQTEEIDKVEEPKVETADTVAKAEFDGVRKALEDAQAEIKKMQRERKEAEFVVKAKELGNLGAANEVGAIMLEASEGMSVERYQSLERLLKAANAQLESSNLFAAFGRSDGEAAESAEDRLTELAKAKVAAGQSPTIEQAKQAVLHENAELRSELMSARRSL